MTIADTHEPAPVPNDRPAVWALVISDMQARDAEGRRKYGTPLQPFNGRDALVDAYQDALDLAVYLRQAIEERGAPPVGDVGAVKTLDELAIEADNFARTTFPARSAESISEHLRREAVELAAAPNDAEEMADVFILLGNLVHFTGTDLNAAVVAKLAKNRARKWGKPDAQGVVEHVRDEAQKPGLLTVLDETPAPDPLTADEPIHHAFGLSYASYLVVPRTVLQSMPVAWQAKFVALMNETHERFPGWEPPWPQGWTVHLRGKKGRFLEDDLARYERGRRQLEPGKPARAGVDTWPDGGATP